MGFVENLLQPLVEKLAGVSLPVLAFTATTVGISLLVLFNVLSQSLLKNPNVPPLVFHWFPFVGNTVSYGIDPIVFFRNCREKYGDCFTFILLGRPMTVYLGPKGNDFILNGKLKDVCAEDIYGPLTTPIFGKDVVYDCPNSKLMEQKKFMKFGLTTESFRSYVTIISEEVTGYVKRTPMFKGNKGVFEVITTMAKVTIFTAAGSLQGKEVREKFDESFADLYHDLDQGFSPINFMLPWFPFPHNRKRDAAHKKMVEVYTDIIRKRRAGEKQDSQDMIWNLMQSSYKNGKQVPDYEIARMMIALLMAGQHSSSSTISWAVLHLAMRPDIQEALIAEQKAVLGTDLQTVTYEDLSRLTLHSQVIKETLRIHSPIHSIMRKVKSPMPVSGTSWVIPTTHTLMATPLFAGVSEEYFPNAYKWDPRRWEENSGGIKLPSVDGDEEKTDYGYGMVSKGANSPYLPFGAGRHRCIGEQFAYVQLQTILVNLVRIFKFSEGPGQKGVPPTDYSSLFSRPLPPATVSWEKREKDNEF